MTIVKRRNAERQSHHWREPRIPSECTMAGPLFVSPNCVSEFPVDRQQVFNEAGQERPASGRQRPAAPKPNSARTPTPANHPRHREDPRVRYLDEAPKEGREALRAPRMHSRVRAAQAMWSMADMQCRTSSRPRSRTYAASCSCCRNCHAFCHSFAQGPRGAIQAGG